MASWGAKHRENIKVFRAEFSVFHFLFVLLRGVRSMQPYAGRHEEYESRKILQTKTLANMTERHSKVTQWRIEKTRENTKNREIIQKCTDFLIFLPCRGARDLSDVKVSAVHDAQRPNK